MLTSCRSFTIIFVNQTQHEYIACAIGVLPEVHASIAQRQKKKGTHFMPRKQITINDIAKDVGVSKTTISRYLNGKYEFMSPETKKRISDTIANTGYRPNRLANSLKTSRSNLIGVIMSNIMASQTPQLLGSICDTCTKNGRKIVVVNSENNPEREKQMVQDLLDQQVDGLLVVSGYNSDLYQALDRNDLPVVLADRLPKDGDADMDSVVINHAESTRRVIRYLLNQGYQRVILLQRRHRNPNNTPALRSAAAVAACREFFGDDTHCRCVELPADPESPSAVDFNAVVQVMEDTYRESRNVPTAIFVTEVTIMHGVACSYYRAGMQLSSSFTISGYVNSNLRNIFVPPICTICLLYTSPRPRDRTRSRMPSTA